MGIFIYAFFSTFALVLALVIAVKHGDLAYIEGQKHAYKLAIDMAKEKGDVAILVAPPGMLRQGLERAQTAHQLEMDLRQLLSDVR